MCKQVKKKTGNGKRYLRKARVWVGVKVQRGADKKNNKKKLGKSIWTKGKGETGLASVTKIA